MNFEDPYTFSILALSYLLLLTALAGCIVPYCRKDFIYDESLLLRGMERIYRLNCK